jgi:hypothetical protein
MKGGRNYNFTTTAAGQATLLFAMFELKGPETGEIRHTRVRCLGADEHS